MSKILNINDELRFRQSISTFTNDSDFLAYLKAYGSNSFGCCAIRDDSKTMTILNKTGNAYGMCIFVESSTVWGKHYDSIILCGGTAHLVQFGIGNDTITISACQKIATN